MHERERWQMILGAIKDRAVVTVRELIVRTGASPATLRRDLAKLEESGADQAGAWRGRGAQF